MRKNAEQKSLFDRYVIAGDHAASDYFALIRELIQKKATEGNVWQDSLTEAYRLLGKEIHENHSSPTQQVTFGTSGWRGKLGKDINMHSVAGVTLAIVRMYQDVDQNKALAELLGVESLQEAKQRGCVLGFDNRFGGETLAAVVAAVLDRHGFAVHYAGESTTGVLSAAVLRLQAAFSINLTPSHNPLEYGGYKFNAADGGPAATEVTEQITRNAREILASKEEDLHYPPTPIERLPLVQAFNSLRCWLELVHANMDKHGLDRDAIAHRLAERDDIFVAVDCVHGASRLHVKKLLGDGTGQNIHVLRDSDDVTFGGVAPEPSTKNMQQVVNLLAGRREKLKLGAIIDPDGDRIRFTDGQNEISMNHFGAMAYHFLHEHKGQKGMVGKTVATSNLANAIAKSFGEKVFEPAVGFKNFKSVIGKALVYFEESDGISIIGHTPEKDAYIGLLLAVEMLLTLNLNLGQYLAQIEKEYGAYYPDRDGVVVNVQGEALLATLQKLDSYKPGKSVEVGEKKQTIAEVITIDGHKIILDDGSWLMIRPSGTEPKVRFYVESRSPAGTRDLVATAQKMLKEVGIQ
jgi:phosphomannomutase